MAVVTVNKNIQGGVPCFTGTRVPVSVLFDHLKKGYTIAEFRADFPSVTQSQAEAALDLADADLQSRAEHVGNNEAAS